MYQFWVISTRGFNLINRIAIEIDGFKIAQSLAIERYLAKKFGFYGSSDKNAAIADMIREALHEFLEKWVVEFKEVITTKFVEFFELSFLTFDFNKKFVENNNFSIQEESRKKIEDGLFKTWVGYFEEILKNNGGEYFSGEVIIFNYF